MRSALNDSTSQSFLRIALFSILCSHVSLGYGEVSSPDIRIVSSEVDSVPLITKSGEGAVKHVTVRNSGNAKLIVREISASCTCTDAAISKKEIAAGGTAVVRVVVKGEGFGDRSAVVLLETNIPHKPEVYLRVKYRVETHPMFQATETNLGRYVSGEPFEAHVSIAGPDLETFEEGYVIKLEGEPADWKLARVDSKFVLRCEEVGSPGKFSCSATIRRKSDGNIVAATKLNWEVLATSLHCTPSSFYIGEVKLGDTLSRTILLSDMEKLAVGKVMEVSSKSFKVTFSELADKGSAGKALRVRMRLVEADYSEGSALVEDSLDIRLEDHRRISIPIAGVSHRDAK